jgi:hypothetical protein
MIAHKKDLPTLGLQEVQMGGVRLGPLLHAFMDGAQSVEDRSCLPRGPR